MASSPEPQLPLSAAGRLARAREILSEAGRTPAHPVAVRARAGALDPANDPAASEPIEPDAPSDPSAPAPAAEPDHVDRQTALAFAVLSGAVRPLAAPVAATQSSLVKLGTRLFPPAKEGQPSRLELTALGAALVGAAFIGSTLPGGPVAAQGAPQYLAAAPAAAAVAAAPAAAAAATTDDTSDSSTDTAATSTDSASNAAAASTDTSATPAATDDSTSSTDDTSGGSDTSDSSGGTDPLAGSGGGDTLGRVALVVVHGDAPAQWATAPAGSAAAKRAALGTTFTGLATLPNAPLATGLAYVAGQPSNPSTRTGCSAASPLTPGTVDDAGVTAGTGCDYPSGTPSIAGAVARDGRVWKAYTPAATAQEAAARLCHPVDGDGTPEAHAFAQRSPLGHLGDLTGSGACDAAASPTSALKADLASDSAPAWVYVEVGDCGSDGCDATEATARDQQLDDVLATLKAATDPNGGNVATLVVGDGDVSGLAAADPTTFPKAAGDPDAPAAVTSGALLLGDDVQAGHTDPLAIDPYAIALTQAKWLGLTAPGLGAGDGESALAVPGA